MISKKQNIIKWIESLFIITIGCIIAAFSITGLLSPNQIFDGGVVGVSMILSQKVNVSMSLLMCLINAPIVIYGYKKLGKKFLIKVVYSMLTFSILLKYFTV